MKGAEAALPNAIDDARVDYVIGISPSSVVWANIGAGRDGVEWPQRSSWTRAGVPLPFIALRREPSDKPEGGAFRIIPLRAIRLPCLGAVLIVPRACPEVVMKRCLTLYVV